MKNTIAFGCLISLMALSSCTTSNSPRAVSTVSQTPPVVQNEPAQEPGLHLTALEQFDHNLLDLGLMAPPSETPSSIRQVAGDLQDAPPRIQYNPRGTFTAASRPMANNAPASYAEFSQSQ